MSLFQVHRYRLLLVLPMSAKVNDASCFYIPILLVFWPQIPVHPKRLGANNVFLMLQVRELVDGSSNLGVVEVFQAAVNSIRETGATAPIVMKGPFATMIQVTDPLDKIYIGTARAGMCAVSRLAPHKRVM